MRGTLEYDERNIFGYAIGATFRVQLSYLPDFLILDPQVEANYQQVQDRLARRITLSGVFPDVGLGPLVRAQADAVYVRDLERDFALDKESGTGTLIYRPGREFQVSLGQSLEDNDIHLFQFNSISEYVKIATGRATARSGRSCASPTARASSSRSASTSPGTGATTRSTRSEARTCSSAGSS